MSHNDDLSKTRASKQPDDWKLMHLEAAKIERRMERSVKRASQRVSSMTSISELATAIGFGDTERAMALFPKEAVREAYSPTGTIAKDAVAKGGRIGAGLVRKEAERAGLVEPRKKK